MVKNPVKSLTLKGIAITAVSNMLLGYGLVGADELGTLIQLASVIGGGAGSVVGIVTSIIGRFRKGDLKWNA